jgi:cytochrome c oxidase assembly protein subunit 11
MTEKSHTKLIMMLVLLVIVMIAFSFALVPLYNTLCRTLGINGKPNNKPFRYDAKSAKISLDREVLVEFIATNYGALPWAFYPETKKVKVHPGEFAKLAFYAENQSNYRMTVQAIPTVIPGIAAKYLKKTECFCFTQQTLNGHEAMDMPLLFHLDPELPSEVKTITLSYTLFDVTDKVRN